ncbi:MAG: AAA family ATPase [Nocardioidaceae bacterium]
MRPRGSAVAPPEASLVGRIGEQQMLHAALDDAANGMPCAYLIHGEAGVGKTRLVHEVCDHARERGFTVLWGRCVRLGVIEASYHPLLRALNEWAEDADPAERTSVLGSAATVDELAAGASTKGSSGPEGLFAAVDSVIGAIAGRDPTILVVDDLQWADLASRDALAYLIAGFHRQRLAVLATYRDEDLVAGHSLHGWLADARRLPAVVELGLSRLSKDEIQEQLRHLLDREPPPMLVDEVMLRSNGNPYLSELLVQDLPRDAERLPDKVSAALSDALLARWHQLPGGARAVLGILAVAGRPVTSTRLAKVVSDLGLPHSAGSTALQVATNHGIVVSLGGDVYWFRHPLLAELLYATYSTTQVAPVHGAWARELSSVAREGVEELQRQGDLALHHELSGDLRLSLEASLRAADLAEEIQAAREVAQHLQRATRLCPMLYDGVDGRRREVELLERAARASRRVGDGAESLAALTRALELVDASCDPLTASRIMAQRADTAWFMGPAGTESIDELTRAVELSREWPDSQEYAEALATLSGSESWMAGRLHQGKQHAEEAVAAAGRSRSVSALSSALVVRAYASGFGDAQADQDTQSALAMALESGEPELACWAYLARHNFFEARGRLAESVAVLREGYDFARDAAELSMTVFLSGALAKVLVAMGRLHEAGAVIREGLARSAVPNSAVFVRLAAVILAVRWGQLGAADLHMQRAEELMPALEYRPALEAPPVMAEFELAHKRAGVALRLLTDTLEVQAVDPRIADLMMCWGARAAADLAERARDRRDQERLARARAALHHLIARRQAIAPVPFTVLTPRDLVQPAVEAMFEAESARCEKDAGTSSAWEEAVRRCDAAGMRWPRETSRLRWSQALAVEGVSRSVVAAQLRTGHRFCLEVGASSLQQEFEGLAQVCGVDLTEPTADAGSVGVEPPFDRLTARERQVLSHLVAGRTYGEIADALFITEKTVSTHVSNLLSKTGTRSRREVAILFRRTGMDTRLA